LSVETYFVFRWTGVASGHINGANTIPACHPVSHTCDMSMYLVTVM